MRFYIPEPGDKFILTEDWVFNCVTERRNSGMLLEMGLVTQTRDKNYHNPHGVITGLNVTTTLPVGTEIQVDCVRIRKLQDNTISFRAKLEGIRKTQRFWVYLHELSGLEFREAP